MYSCLGVARLCSLLSVLVFQHGCSAAPARTRVLFCGGRGGGDGLVVADGRGTDG